MAARFGEKLALKYKFVDRLIQWNLRRVHRHKMRKQGRRLSAYDHKLAVLGIMKNEARNIDEWIEHYLWQGAGRIVLIDNGSTDDSFAIAQRWTELAPVEVVSLTEKWKQCEHYWTAIRQFRLRETCEWLLVADLDEFWFRKDGGKLSDILDSYEKTDVVYANWTNFGSNGLVEHPESLRQSLTLRAPDLSTHFITKWLCRSAALKKQKNIEIHKIAGVCSSRTISDNLRLQINHYPIQSVEYFQDVKMVRGDVNTPRNEMVRDMAYFEKLDAPCIVEELLLSDMVAKSKVSQD